MLGVVPKEAKPITLGDDPEKQKKLSKKDLDVWNKLEKIRLISIQHCYLGDGRDCNNPLGQSHACGYEKMGTATRGREEDQEALLYLFQPGTYGRII